MNYPRHSPHPHCFYLLGSTASASELVINGLDPHVEVVMVGADTYGKQVGQGRWDMHEGIEGLEREDCDVALRMTAFEIVNGENQGDTIRWVSRGRGGSRCVRPRTTSSMRLVIPKKR